MNRRPTRAEPAADDTVPAPLPAPELTEAECRRCGTYGETTGRRLFAAAADLTRLAGWTSYD
ncbi:hypothetical protein, partial [Streptomyces roseus]